MIIYCSVYSLGFALIKKIYQTLETVFHWLSRHLEFRKKILRSALYFQLSSWCVDIPMKHSLVSCLGDILSQYCPNLPIVHCSYVELMVWVTIFSMAWYIFTVKNGMQHFTFFVTFLGMAHSSTIFSQHTHSYKRVVCTLRKYKWHHGITLEHVP